MKKALIATIVFIVLGSLLLIIGMVSGVQDPTTGETSSISDVIKGWNDAAGDLSGTIFAVDKINLFDVHEFLIDNKELLSTPSPLLGWTQEDADAFLKLVSYANTAIAGFSFFIIAIISGIAAVILKFLGIE